MFVILETIYLHIVFQEHQRLHIQDNVKHRQLPRPSESYS